MKYLKAVLACAVLAGAVSVEAKLITKPVAYEHAGVKLEGWLVYDDSVQGQRPGVLVVHEWWGLNDYARHRAEQLARLIMQLARQTFTLVLMLLDEPRR